MTYRLYAFIPDEFDFNRFLTNIKEHFSSNLQLDISVNDKDHSKSIWLNWPNFKMVLSFLKPVAEELRDIVNKYANKHPDKEQILISKLLIVIDSEEDSEEEYFNDFISLSELIYEIPGVILWDPDTYDFIDPNSGEQKKFY